MAEFELEGRRVFVAGHRGMVGSACARRLEREGCHLVTAERAALDLMDQAAVRRFMADTRPDAVLVAAAKVGGIMANSTFPAEFIHDNLVIATNLIGAAHEAGVRRLLFLGSSCIYPKEAPQPIREEALLSGPLEPTNEWYAIAKIAGVKLCQAFRRQYGVDFISAMPCNLYGPNDHFHPERSHVIPGLMRRFHEAKLERRDTVTCWGTGRPRREFLHVDDLADACAFLLRRYAGEQHINVGSGTDVSIAELAGMIRRVTGFEGAIEWDTGRPDGTMLKCMDTSRIEALGWQPRIPLEAGLAATYAWFLRQPTMRA